MAEPYPFPPGACQRALIYCIPLLTQHHPRLIQRKETEMAVWASLPSSVPRIDEDLQRWEDDGGAVWPLSEEDEP